VVREADAILACSGAAKFLGYIADLKHHIYGVSDQPTAKLRPRPESVFQWDRKALSHLHFFGGVGVSLDPGNLALFCGLLVLLRRIGAVTEDGERACLCQACSQRQLKFVDRVCQMGGEISEPSLFIGLIFVQLLKMEGALRLMKNPNKRRMEYAGDILEAWGGVCHPWNRHAALLQGHVIKQLSLSVEQVAKFRCALGNFMKQVKLLLAAVWRLLGSWAAA